MPRARDGYGKSISLPVGVVTGPVGIGSVPNMGASAE